MRDTFAVWKLSQIFSTADLTLLTSSTGDEGGGGGSTFQPIYKIITIIHGAKMAPLTFVVFIAVYRLRVDYICIFQK